MKIYILLDVYLDSERHCDFVDAFNNPEDMLKYIIEHQSDGHKFEYVVKEFKDDAPNLFDNPWTIGCPGDELSPLKPNKQSETPATDYPHFKFPTWAYPPCYFGGPCTNPQHDCVNCPGLSGGSSGGTWTSDGTGAAENIKTIRQHTTTSDVCSANTAMHTAMTGQITTKAAD